MDLETINLLLFVAGPPVVIGGVGAVARWFVYRHANELAEAQRSRAARRDEQVAQDVLQVVSR